MNYAKAIIAGNLTRDPEIKVLGSGTTICSFGVAVNYSYKNAAGERIEELSFIDVTYFGKAAEHCARHFGKGKPIFLEGRLKMESWETASGDKRSRIVIIGEGFPQFVGPKSDNEDGGSGYPSNSREPQRPAQSGQTAFDTNEGGDNEDIPF